MFGIFFFFFKQKTAYEMRISDWSSDVCSSDLFTRDLARGHRVVAKLEAGTCWINTYNVTPIAMPFGGVKQSGIGRENGRAAIEHYTQLKSVYVAMNAIESPY